MGKCELIYCATPGRINDKKNEIMELVEEKGQAPFHPFQAFPYELFEGGEPGRENTIKFCKRAIDICDQFWLFGVSKGTLTELNHAIEKEKQIKLFHEEFDPEWKEKYEELKEDFDKPLERLD